jgi:hypothetical protein
MARLFSSVSKWLNKLLPRKIHDDPAYQAAHKFKNTFSPKEGGRLQLDRRLCATDLRPPRPS